MALVLNDVVQRRIIMRGDQTVLKEVGLSFPLAISSESNEKFVGHAMSKGIRGPSKNLSLIYMSNKGLFSLTGPSCIAPKSLFFSFLIESLRHWELEWVVGAPSLAAS